MQNKILALAALSILALSPSFAQAEGKDGVAAIVNGEKITVKEMKQGYEDNAPIKEQVSFPKYYEKALDIYVNGKLLYQAAVADGVTETPEYARAVKAMKEDLARNMYIDKFAKKKVTESESKKLYKDYKKTFKDQKEAHAKHILVDTESEAKSIIAKLKKGEKFDDLAKKYSKDPVADLGYFTKNQMVPEFSNAVFAMKKGKFSQTPVKTQFGYHVILLEDIRDAEPQPYDKVKPGLQKMLYQNAVGELFKQVLDKAQVSKYSLDGEEIKDPVVMLGAPQK